MYLVPKYIKSLLKFSICVQDPNSDKATSFLQVLQHSLLRPKNYLHDIKQASLEAILWSRSQYIVLFFSYHGVRKMPFFQRISPEQPQHPKKNYYVDLFARKTSVYIRVKWYFQLLKVLVWESAPENSFFHFILSNQFINGFDFLSEFIFDIFVSQTKLFLELVGPRL